MTYAKKKNTMSNNAHVSNIKTDYSSKNCTSNNYKSQVAYVENNLYNRYANITFTNTNNKSENTNQYTTGVVNNYKNQQSFKSKKENVL